MECTTEVVFDVGSLYAHFQGMKDSRKPRGLRYELERRFISIQTGEVQEQVVYGFTSLSREEITPKKLLKKIRSYWGIENGLHYRRDVTLREDRTRMTKGRSGQFMACLNNIVIGLVCGKTNYAYLPHARCYFDVHPNHAFALISQL